MTKYALLTEFAPPDHGGIQASVGPIIEALGSDVTVIAPQKINANRQYLQRSLFSGRSWPRWWWLVGWLKQARSQGLEAVIFGHFSAAVLAGLICRRWYGLPYVILIHGNDLLFERNRWPVRWFIRSALRSARFIGVNSSFVERLVSEYGVPRYRIIRTHPFVRQENIPDGPATVNGHRLITVSRLVPRKNIAAVIQAVSELHEQYPDLHFDVVGDGPERKNLEALIHSLNLETVVTFHGAVDEATKWRLLQQADVFVMVPKVLQGGQDVEGLGLVYLEAAAAKLPIVASQSGGVGDAVVDHQTGLLVDPDQQSAMTQAIRTLWQQPELGRSFGQAGFDLVQSEFTDRVRVTRCVRMLSGFNQADQPLVSIIIPAYNAAASIGRTLASVKGQTWTNLEVIVVDDGSTDDLSAALKPYAENLILIRQINSGAPTARNVGFEHSRGEYVLFVDADVTLDRQAVQKMIITLSVHPESAYVYSDFYFGWKKFHLFEYSSSKLHRQNYIHTNSLIRREAFPKFDPTLKKFQDWDLWLTMDEQGRRGIWIPEVLFRVAEQARGVGMSTWLPSFMYRLPVIGQGRGNATIANYRQAEAIIRKKHGR